MPCDPLLEQSLRLRRPGRGCVGLAKSLSTHDVRINAKRFLQGGNGQFVLTSGQEGQRSKNMKACDLRLQPARFVDIQLGRVEQFDVLRDILVAWDLATSVSPRAAYAGA